MQGTQPRRQTGSGLKLPPRDGVPRPEVRHAVQHLLTRSEAFAALDPDKRRQIANDMVKIADYLAMPEGIMGTSLPTAQGMAPLAQAQAGTDTSTYSTDVQQVDKIGQADFKAGSAREGAEVAGLFLSKINFPVFVSSLIEGVFHAIVKATIEQMEAYAKLVSSVAMSLNDFRDHNTTDNQGRDHLIEQHPDIFQLDESGDTPKLAVKDSVDESSALKRLNSSMQFDDGKPLSSLDLSDEETENKLTQAARTQLATGRQQLLATMVMMGINRIVVTDGKISAKIMYDFQARDTRSMRRSASAYDYARDKGGGLQKLGAYSGSYESKTEGGSGKYSYDKDSGYQGDYRGANYYAKGDYKYSEQPVMTAMSVASETTDAALTTRAQLAGNVEVNFKSDYLPLEKMVDPAQIAQLQLAARPGAAKATPTGAPAPAGQTPAAATTPAQGGAPAAAPAR